MKHKNTNREYAFLMVEYETPKFIKDLQDSIKKEELYTEEDNDDYGLEKESHVTLVPCLDNDINLDELKNFLKNISEYDIILTDISKFECENYDVLNTADVLITAPLPSLKFSFTNFHLMYLPFSL